LLSRVSFHSNTEMKKNIVVIGSSGHAKVIIDIIEKQDAFTIAGIIDPYRTVGETLLGYSVLGKEEDLPTLMEAHGIIGCVIALGDNWLRKKVADKINSIVSLEHITAIHPSAQIAKDVMIGKGTVIMAGAIINTSSRVGDFVIINTKSSLDHDNQLGDFASIAPGATTGGNVRIGDFSAIAIGAIIKHGVSVCEHSIIGAASLVLKDVEAYRIAFGIPAKIIKERKAGDKYL
jgi:sugar O-acyltransferase (sialic acid O-acetyltransferase NeuD family)